MKPLSLDNGHAPLQALCHHHRVMRQLRDGVGVCPLDKGGRKMKTAIIVLCALIVAAPAVLAQNVSSKTQAHHAARTHHRVVSAGHAPRPVMHAKGYPGTFGYAPNAPKDYTYENSSNAGGGGGGGSGM
jgi:hypothetical protein